MHASSEAFPGGRGWRRIYIPGGLGPRLDNDDDQGTETRKTSQFRESDSEKGRGQGGGEEEGPLHRAVETAGAGSGRGAASPDLPPGDPVQSFLEKAPWAPAVATGAPVTLRNMMDGEACFKSELKITFSLFQPFFFFKELDLKGPSPLKCKMMRLIEARLREEWPRSCCRSLARSAHRGRPDVSPRRPGPAAAPSPAGEPGVGGV